MSAAPLGALVAAEASKARRQPSTFVLAGILVAYLVLIVGALASVLHAPQGQAGAPDMTALLKPLRADAVGFLASIASSIATILLVVFAAQITAQEFSRGTMRTLLLHGARRRDVAVAKLFVLACASLALALVVLLGSVAGAALFSFTTGETLLREHAASLAVRGLRIFAGLAAWAAITFGATLATRSLGVGIGASLGGLIAGDALAGLLSSIGPAGIWASRALPNTAISLLSGSTPIEASAWGWIIPSLIFYVVALNAIAVWQLEHLDIISATK